MIRMEVHTRTAFAQRKAKEYFTQMKFIEKNGNLLSSRATQKFSQAKRVYDHYCAEFWTSLILANAPHSDAWKNLEGYTKEGKERLDREIDALPDDE